MRIPSLMYIVWGYSSEISFIKAANDVFKNKQTYGDGFISRTIASQFEGVAGVIIWRFEWRATNTMQPSFFLNIITNLKILRRPP